MGWPRLRFTERERRKALRNNDICGKHCPMKKGCKTRLYVIYESDLMKCDRYMNLLEIFGDQEPIPFNDPPEAWEVEDDG